MRPDRIVLDSNVIISAFLFGGPPREVLQRVVDGKVACFASLPILDEVRDVLRRPKFGLSADQALAVVQQLREICELVSPTAELRVVRTDPDDNRILECAMAAEADVIVTGDSDLLALGAWKGKKILNPADYLKQFRDADAETDDP